MVAFSSQFDLNEMVKVATEKLIFSEKSGNAPSEANESSDKNALSEANESSDKKLLYPFHANNIFSAMGSLVADAVSMENGELDSHLLEIVRPDQIVRRLPLGNTFILADLTLAQAQAIADLNRTALLSLSLFKRLRDNPHLKLKSAKVNKPGPFDDEPIIGGIKSFEPLHKGKKENLIQYPFHSN